MILSNDIGLHAFAGQFRSGDCAHVHLHARHGSDRTRETWIFLSPNSAAIIVMWLMGAVADRRPLSQLSPVRSRLETRASHHFNDATKTARMTTGQKYLRSHTEAARASADVSDSSSLNIALADHPTKMLVRNAPTGRSRLEQA